MTDIVLGIRLEGDGTSLSGALKLASGELVKFASAASSTAAEGGKVVPALAPLPKLLDDTGKGSNALSNSLAKVAQHFSAKAIAVNAAKAVLHEFTGVIRLAVAGLTGGLVGAITSAVLSTIDFDKALKYVMDHLDDTAALQDRLNKIWDVSKSTLDGVALSARQAADNAAAISVNLQRAMEAELVDVQKKLDAVPKTWQQNARREALRQQEVEIKSRIAVMKAALGDWDSTSARLFDPSKIFEDADLKKIDQATAAQKAIQAQVAALQSEAAATQMSTRDRAIQVELLKAEATARQGGTVVTAVQAEAIKKAAGATFDYSSNLQFQNALMKDAQSIFESTRTPVEKYAREIDNLNGLLALGKINQDTYDRAVQQSNQRLVEADPILSNVAQGIHEIGDSLLDVAEKGGSAWDILTAGLKRFERALFELGVENPLLNALFNVGKPTLGTAFQNLFGTSVGSGSGVAGPGVGGIWHAGGIIGRDSAPTRYVHPAYFDAAPRMHGGGIAGDEKAIIARDGEGIFTPRQMDNADALIAAALSSRGDVAVTVIDQRGGNAAPPKISQGRGPDGRRELQILLRDGIKSAISSGDVDTELKQSFGLNRVGVR